MKKAIIEFIIGRNGGIRSTVKEVKGAGCEKITESLKQCLGEVASAKRTAEYYARVDATVHVINKE